MDTIKEAAVAWKNSSSNPNILGLAYINDFEAGVKFAQRWIPVKEELPPLGVEVIVKERFNEFDVYLFYSSKDRLTKLQDNFITHWRMVEYK